VALGENRPIPAMPSTLISGGAVACCAAEVDGNRPAVIYARLNFWILAKMLMFLKVAS